MMMKKLFLLLSSAVLAVSASAVIDNGSMAPSFTLQTPAGESVSLSDFKGDYVVLEWVNPGCPFVKKFYNAGAMQQFQAEAKAMGEGTEVVWLSINSTTPSHRDYLSPEASTDYYAEKDVKSIWLLDPTGEVGKAYDATNTPHMFVIDPAGKVVYQGAIDSIRSADAADIAKADNYVMGALKALLTGSELSPEKTRPYGCTIKY